MKSVPNMFDSLKAQKVYMDLEWELIKASAPLSASGCMGSQKIQLASGLAGSFDRVLYVTADEMRAQTGQAEAQTFTENTAIFLAKDLLFHNLNTQSRYLVNRRMEVLKGLTSGAGGIIFASIEALLDPVPSAGSLDAGKLSLAEGMTISPGALTKALTGLNYERVESVESIGEFAVRGGIADIYPAAAEMPVRIEFFDDEIESVRNFNTYTQRSTAALSRVDIYPFRDNAGDFPASSGTQGTGAENDRDIAGGVSLLDYFGEGALVILDDPVRITERARAVENELSESIEQRIKNGITDSGPGIFPPDFIIDRILSGRCLVIPALDESLGEFRVKKDFHFRTGAVGHYKGSYNLLIETLKKYEAGGYRVTLMTPSAARASRIAGEMRDLGLKAYCPDPGASQELKKGETEVVVGSLTEGFIYTDIKYVLMTENDMFGRTALRRRRRKKYDGLRIGALNELKPGDYVVHEQHGIGIYKGIEHIVRDDVGKDYMTVEYADGGKLYLPVTKLDLIQKYGGAEGARPRINKLNGTEWARTRERVDRSVRDIARELTSLYAARLNSPGYKYGRDTAWQKEFEELFPFEETPDQLSAIESVKADMESGHIMDRLICGDVGYGKTEIAMRAAFKAAQEGKQTAMLVPTTILAAQHYKTFSERFEKFPVRVEMLSRFRDSAQNKKTIEELAAGKIDIIIGTHRLLSDDVRFNDLGLLVVDEEQRFGVAHKEKIKKLKHNVEALSLTATPIPRTLHMSLAGIRDLSILDEPPFDRVPIQTYVLEYNDEYVREAVNRELMRGGQVFYVYNRVKNIEEKCTRVREMIPGANIEYAHGQMPERELEGIMEEFVNGEIDVLVSTTIIESGLDIPNANTIIVDGAERMGLSQLYQLRGRVGRSGRTAYAFFMYRKDRILKEEAEKRLKAIREFTGFGSGIKIAMRDLEIRGAGNVLGAEQHGEIGAVGYDLYLKLLNKAVMSERGLTKEEPQFQTSIDCAIDAYIPADYIKDEFQKLEIYKRISEIAGKDDYDELIDELTDRFGAPPAETVNLMDIARLKADAHRAYVTELNIREGSILMHMFVRARIDVGAIPGLIEKEEGKLRFITGAHPRFIYTEKRGIRQDVGTMIKKTAEIISQLTI